MSIIDIPFRVDASGGIAVTDDRQTIAEQQIMDVLATHVYERVMRPLYGAGLRALLFDNVGPTELGDAANVAIAACAEHVTAAVIREIRFASWFDSTSSGGVASGVTADVRYVLPPLDMTFELHTPVLFMTEESPLG